ncbi:hypothetical protein H5410_059210 [Solanum commersonii]|uniref:Uncharacterized protein n=1 Tax=Solanum commersonii TaxID=4109 RepID=A0A9J5W299_SOLCO|nr:hypothetical protein H5410_059210 [Solanum commersonii]
MSCLLVNPKHYIHEKTSVRMAVPSQRSSSKPVKSPTSSDIFSSLEHPNRASVLKTLQSKITAWEILKMLAVTKIYQTFKLTPGRLSSDARTSPKEAPSNIGAKQYVDGIHLKEFIQATYKKTLKQNSKSMNRTSNSI